MKIVVFGTGLVGGQVLSNLTATRNDIVALDRKSGVDTTTGAGLAEVLVGADVVVDLTNTREWSDDRVLAFFRDSTTHLLAAEHDAGVRHHVVLSVVGADRVPESAYLRAKHAQEQLVASGTIPYTILRSTQFFEFLGDIADVSTVEGVVHAPSAMLQPIALRDVAAQVTAAALGEPINGLREIAGPERLGLDELMRRVLAATDDRRMVETRPTAAYFGAILTDVSLTPGSEAWIGSTRLDEWLGVSH